MMMELLLTRGTPKDKTVMFYSFLFLALECIKSFIEVNIHNQEFDNMKKRFSHLLEVIDKSIKSLSRFNENRKTN